MGSGEEWWVGTKLTGGSKPCEISVDAWAAPVTTVAVRTGRSRGTSSQGYRLCPQHNLHRSNEGLCCLSSPWTTSSHSEDWISTISPPLMGARETDFERLLSLLRNGDDNGLPSQQDKHSPIQLFLFQPLRPPSSNFNPILAPVGNTWVHGTF